MNLPKVDWCQQDMTDSELARFMNEYQTACRNQFRAITFTHDLCLDEESGGYKVGEAAFLARFPNEHGAYGCFWLGHQNAQHCYCAHIPFLDVIPKLITLKRAVVKIYEDAGMNIVALPLQEEGEPHDLTTVWLMDIEGAFCIRTKDGALDPMELQHRWQGFSDCKIFSSNESLKILEGQLFEYSFPPA